MADVKKKSTGRKIKRSVKKTLGALFLASAIAVADGKGINPVIQYGIACFCYNAQ